MPNKMPNWLPVKPVLWEQIKRVFPAGNQIEIYNTIICVSTRIDCPFVCENLSDTQLVDIVREEEHKALESFHKIYV